MELRKRQTAHAAALEPDQRRDPAVRRRMSGPAMRTFFNVAAAWRISNDDQRALLGWPPESTFFKYKSGEIGTLAFDMLLRVSLVLGIYKDLHILYAEDALADGWMQLPNNNPLFGGQSALTFVIGSGMDGLYQVRRLLDARRGGWN